MARRFRLFQKAPEAIDKIESLKGYLANEAYAVSAFAIFYGCLTWALEKTFGHPNGLLLKFHSPHSPGVLS